MILDTHRVDEDGWLHVITSTARAEDTLEGLRSPDFRTNWTHVLFTAVPPTADPTKVIAFLHDHRALINLSPLVTSYNETGSDNHQVSYDIRERVPVLPAGLWDQEICFSAVSWSF